jgi:dihydrolipoamide dehydrogenase
VRDVTCKLLVIGAGPGGYVCAIRAGQLGIETVVVEANKLGGTCLNIGCIPSKALIHAADEFVRVAQLASGANPLGILLAAPQFDLAKTMQWKDSIVGRLTGGVSTLLKNANVKTVEGWARFLDGKTVEVESEIGIRVIRAEHVVIATGSKPVELPVLPFTGPVISSAEALSLKAVPRRLAVVGAGYIGLELGIAFAKIGAEVTVIEEQPRILPQYDLELTRPVGERLRALGVKVLTGAKVKELLRTKCGFVVERSDGSSATIEADRILVAVGRKPATDGWDLEAIDLDMDGQFIAVDDQCRTSMRGVYAIGDVTGDPMLAHRAFAQGAMVAEIVAGKRRTWDRTCIPAICFTDPEVAVAGLTPEMAKAKNIEIITDTFPFRANGRAMTVAAEAGFIRVVARADNHLLVGIQGVGTGISELSAAFSLAVEMGARLEDVTGTIFAHPTLSEGMLEAALKTLGRPVHI